MEKKDGGRVTWRHERVVDQERWIRKDMTTRTVNGG